MHSKVITDSKVKMASPDYQDLNYWAAHPWKWDPSDSVPAPLKIEPMIIGRIDSSVDVFFLHPTSFTKNKDRHIANASIDDDYINAKTDYSTILYQASVFNRAVPGICSPVPAGSYH